MSDTDDEELDKEAVGKKIAEELPPEILQEYKDIFSFFDRDGGGSIGAEEFDQVMRTFGWEPKDEELKEMVSVIDQDGDGTISFNEFVWLMTRLVVGLVSAVTQRSRTSGTSMTVILRTR